MCVVLQLLTPGSGSTRGVNIPSSILEKLWFAGYLDMHYFKKKKEFCGQTEAWVKAGFPPVSEFPAPLIC